jgi:hypothetical protein
MNALKCFMKRIATGASNANNSYAQAPLVHKVLTSNLQAAC